ncbi:helix-turn-helix domain-containing protein [Aliarcobacter butzleri]|uniref:helix-turn-helix domain-containing protein n=1 Tax=Aliarcobacter butzleri TaxID=28197 RepID=UPI0021B29CDF|nr:helix-turn-helix domain-containing protein [Aliarcobacter butzleri]MCT7638474.1 hypothetical protein [Aliarcobacter butzleri]
MNISYVFEKLFNYFNVSTIRDLSKKLNMSESTVSKWRQRNSINAIKKKCRELEIYDEIFLLDSYISPPAQESPPSIYDEVQKKLSKTIEIEEILKMDETIVISFLQVYKKLAKENNLIKLYEALGKLKYDS